MVGCRIFIVPQTQYPALLPIAPTVPSPATARAFNDGQEVVAHQLSYFASEACSTVREEDFCLAEPAGVEQDFTRGRMTSMVFVANPQVEVTQRNPASFAAPTYMDELVVEGQKFSE